MSLQELAEWLRCPHCFLPLAAAEALVLGCGNSHFFDVNKRGFVNLIAGSGKFIGDSPAMLDAREEFLGGGWYEPVRAVVSAIAKVEAAERVLDVGCGTGYYTRGVLDALPAAHALAMDLSPVAVGRTSRSHPAIQGLVADVWAPLPLRNSVTGIILNVFAPRNAPEFHRVLAHNGLLIVVIPQPVHLEELRAAGLAVAIQEGKAAHVTKSLNNGFVLELHEQIRRNVALSPSEVASVVGMGPSAHHASVELQNHLRDSTDVTFAFDVMGFRRV